MVIDIIVPLSYILNNYASKIVDGTLAVCFKFYVDVEGLETVGSSATFDKTYFSPSSG